MRDLFNNVKLASALNPAAVTSNTTVNGTVIDTVGYDSLAFAIASGTLTDGTWTFKLQHGDAANLSDAVDCAADEVHSASGTATVAFAATDDNVTKKIGYRQGKAIKRYVRLVLTTTGVTTGGTIGAVAVQAGAAKRPVA